MLLVPRQLRRAGITGDVPYYGGRFTPAQAYAASHPVAPPPAPSSPTSSAPPSGHVAPSPRSDPAAALAHLLETGVITREEYDELRARVPR